MITIISKSDSTIRIPLSYKITLFVNAVTDQNSPLTYQWRKDGQLLDGATSNTYTIDRFKVGDNSDNYSVTISNTGSDPVTIEGISVQPISLFSGGVRTPILPPTPSDKGYVTIDTFVKGGLHVYESVEEMCNSTQNNNRLKYGQLATVVDPVTSNPPTLYKFNVKDPSTVYKSMVVARELERQSAAANPANWSSDPAYGSGFIGYGELDGNGGISTIIIDNVGANYSYPVLVGVELVDGATPPDLIVVTNEEGIDAGVGPFFDGSGGLLQIYVASPGSGYTQSPQIYVFGGEVETIPPSLLTEAPNWQVGSDWVAVSIGGGGNTGGNGVSLPTGTNGQVLTYNGATNTWVASALPVGQGGGSDDITTFVQQQSATIIPVNTFVQQQSATIIPVNTFVQQQSATIISVSTFVQQQSATIERTTTFVQEQSSTLLQAQTFTQTNSSDILDVIGAVKTNPGSLTNGGEF